MSIIKGCITDQQDTRDLKYSNICGGQQIVNVDLRDSYMPVIWNQGATMACTAYATSAALAYQQARIKGLRFDPSRLFMYYMTRNLDGNASKDSGSQLRTVCRASARYGACYELAYKSDKSNMYTKPTFDNVVVGIDHKAHSYYRVEGFDEVCNLLMSGVPVIIGTNIWEYEPLADGFAYKALENVKLQNPTGHAMLIVGYKKDYIYNGQAQEVFIVRNSWGVNWGDKGYCYIPARQLINNNIGDMWALFVDKSQTDMPMDENSVESNEDNSAYYVVVGSFDKPDKAIMTQDFFAKNGYSPLIKQFQTSVGATYLVTVNGVFDSKVKAEALSDALNAKNMRSFVAILD